MSEHLDAPQQMETHDSGLAPIKGMGPDPLLYLDGVTVSFDGFRALNECSMILDPGEMRAIIGPNGAGKTTLMDVVTGKLKPTSGKVSYKGNIDLTRHDEAYIANLGIGRKFQTPTVFEQQSVFENVELALKADRRIWPTWRFRRTPQITAHIEDTLETVHLSDMRHSRAGALSHGQKQWLEIAMLLVQDLELMLLDEPAAGMSDAETALTAELLQVISKQRSVVVVEHDMGFVESLQCKVTVMHEGSVLAEGTHEAVQNNEEVIRVYLGR